MSAYKKLNSQDVFITDYQAQKQWTATGSILTSYNIDTFRGMSGSATFIGTDTAAPGYAYPLDYYNGQSQKLIYDSIFHNFYADSLKLGTFSGSRDMSLQSTITHSGSRDIRTEVGIISIPKEVYGTHIVPNSFSIRPVTENIDKYISDGYSFDTFTGDNDFIEDIGDWYGSNTLDGLDYLVSESSYVSESALGTDPGQYVDVDRTQQSYEIIDDGDGNLIFSGSELKYTQPKRIVGDIIYNQGMVIFTDTDVARYYSTYSRHNVHWKSNQPIYTYNVHCKVKDSELGFTYNPSAITGSNGVIANNVTGSDFSPYFTTVGLYNDANELIAVAKTNRAIPKPKNSDLTVVIKIDI